MVACLRTLILTLLVTSPVAGASGEKGKPFLESFTPDDYGAHPQNWSIVQDRRGIVFVANLEGVLEYDGARWRQIEHPRRISAWSVARGADGTIFVGASGDIGFLRPDARGVHRFVSLLDRVPESSRGLGAVRQVVSTPSGVFFLEARHVFRWRDGSLTVWSVDEDGPASNSLLSQVNGRTLLARRGEGLLELGDDTFDRLPGTGLFAGRLVTALLPFENQLLVGTSTAGLYLYDRTSVGPWEVDASDYGREHRITGGALLSDGRFSLSTASGGVVLFDRSGTVLRTIDKAAGLPENAVRGPGYEDAHGGLWLPLNHGVARVEVASPLEYFDGDHGLDGLVLAIQRHRGTLYVGTTQGLFQLRTAPRPSFIPVDGLRGGCGDLLSVGELLLAATSIGLLEIRDGRVAGEPLLPVAAWSLAASSDGGRIFVGTRDDGLHAFSLGDGRPVHEGRVGRTSDDIRRIVRCRSGRLWLRAFTPQRTERVERVDPVAGDVGSWRVSVFDDENGFASENEVVPFVWQGQAFASDLEAIYRFVDEEDRFEPDPVLSAEIHGRSGLVGAPLVDGRGRLWFYMSPHRVGRAELGEGGFDLSFPIARARIREVLAFFAEDDGSAVWAGGFDGRVVRCDLSLEHDAETGGRLTPIIRNVRVAGASGELLFGGDTPPAHASLVLPFTSDSLRFEYALPHFDAPEVNEYQIRLVGLGESWSEWSGETYRDFTRLYEGSYRFEVRGRGIHGQVSETAAFEFRVSPPWYRTWWAYAFYTLAFFGALLLVARVQVSKADRERDINARLRELDKLKNERLERLVEEKTERIKVLSGLLPICSRCKKIRDGDGDWNKLEEYIDRHSEASFSHGMCPDCVQEAYPGIDLD